MTEEVGKKVCEGTVADLMKDKTGKQTVVTLTRIIQTKILSQLDFLLY